MRLATLPVDALEVCDRTRARDRRPNPNSEVIQDYAEAYRCGLMVEPLDVFQEKGTERYIVADGEHRLLALRRARIQVVEVRLYTGDEMDALSFAIGRNQQHGVRLTKADRYHQFSRIMETPLRDLFKTDTELSEKLRVSKRTVASYKAEWRESESKTKATRSKKAKAKKEAAKKTPKAKKKKPPKSMNAQWTAEDEKTSAAILDALHELGEAWKKATRPAQLHCSDVIKQTTKSMQ